MLLSIMVVGTGDAFSDQSSIKNTEAVDVAVALNIISGMEDGSYRPANNVTRAQMCKMICIALNGGKEPTLGTNNTPTFNDVRTDPSSSWAESFIESCYTQGIVSGVGSGRFNPSGSVTGTQAARMLLVALGYRADQEGFTGDSWAINVNTIASSKGLYKGIESVDANAALSRDNAAQMIWNALNAYEVEYVSNLATDANGNLTGKLTVQDKVVNSEGQSKVTLLWDKYEAYTRTGIMTSVKLDSMDNTYTTEISGEIPTFDATKDYSSLMGQEVKAMYTYDSRTLKTVLLGIYPTDTNRTVTTVYGDATITSNTAKIDGTEYDITGITTIATNGTVIRSADYATWANYPYMEVTLVDNDKDKVYEYAVVNPYHVVKLSSLTAKKAYFDDTVSTTNFSMDVEDLASYDGMAEDDYAYLTESAYTVSGDWEAVKADTVSGEVSGTKGTTTKSIQIDGSWYEQAVVISGDAITVPQNGDDLEYAVVANGYFFDTEGASGSADRLALVLKVGDQDFDGDYSNVKLLLSDGTTTTTKAYVKSGSTKSEPALGTLYSYTSNSEGYVLKPISTGTDIGMDATIINGAGTKYDSQTNKIGAKRVADDAKVFVLSEGKGNTLPSGTDFTSYTGKLVTGATADKWADANYDVTVAYTDGNVKIMVVNLSAAEIPNATDDSMYGVILSDPYTKTNDDGDTFYVIDLLTEAGVQAGIEVEDAEFNSALVKNQLVTYKMDGSDYVDMDTAPSGATAAVGAVTDVSGKYVDVLADDGTSLELKVDDDDSNILYVDTDAATAGTGEIKKAGKQDSSHYYANIMVIYKTAAETDGTHIIWGAAVDVNNMLQKADDTDKLIDIVP